MFTAWDAGDDNQHFLECQDLSSNLSAQIISNSGDWHLWQLLIDSPQIYKLQL